LATASIPKLNGHFEQVFKYTEQLHPQEIWIVHFSREDFVVSDLGIGIDSIENRISRIDLKID